jgi:hypothetical protein
MNTYNVHIYREMRLFFPGIEADTTEEAAKIAASKDFEDAEDFSDCDGENLAALVDLAGDEDFSESVTVDLNHDAQINKAQAHLLDLLRQGKATISDGKLEYNGTVYAFDDASPDWTALYAAITHAPMNVGE